MKKARKKAIWVLILFLLVLAGSIYVALFGVGDRGKAKYISLGLDLKGGLSVTYEIQDEDYSDADVQDTIYKLQKRIDSHTTEHNVDHCRDSGCNRCRCNSGRPEYRR